MNPEIFKAYDIRGIYPTDINEVDVKNIARAYATWLKPKKIALGRDVRLSGPSLWSAAAEGFIEMGVDVVDIGVITTDMLYFAVANYGFDGGITLSASHNASEYNGMKLVREMSKPISIDSGIAEIRDLTIRGEFTLAEVRGTITQLDVHSEYITKMISLIDTDKIKSLQVVANPNFGAANINVELVAEKLGITITKLNFEQDGNFPKGKPDPMQSALREETAALVKSSAVDFGVIWDADADRCFFYDEKGSFILPYYITGIMMDYFLSRNQGDTVVIDPRLTWLPLEIANKYGSRVAINKSGHSFIKERMRTENAIFGAETSAHYYFRDLWYTDNGLVPFLIMLEMVSTSDKPLSEMIAEYQGKYFAIEEVNFFVDSVNNTIERIKENYPEGEMSYIDGVNIDFPDWHMSLRGSNTEPVIRLNIEAKSQKLAEDKLKELTEAIGGKKA
jgi:phosphomannomutase